MNAYAPVPFWSWNNALEKDELLRQIDDMKSVGCGGFIIHARMGLRVPYLSEEWFSLVETCLDAAKERGMFVWIYDENGWPSGFAGGELLKDERNLEKYLTCEESDVFDDAALAVYVAKDGAYERVHAPVAGARYRIVKMHCCPSYTDVLDPAVVDRFLALTHEQYYKRFSDRFGKELRGFFTDEPQFMRGKTPYSETLCAYWKKNYGGDVTDGLLSLFEDGEAHYAYRVKYYTALNRLYTENYYRRLYEWCSSHGCELTGHSIQENKFFAQMWGSAGVAPTYEFEHVPAIDQLSLGEDASLSARLVGSVAAQTGKKQVLTETFACCGYAATPRQLKAVADAQYVHGVNYMCHHLYAYSLAGQGKYDHPPCFSDHMTWHKQFRSFNDYFTRLGYLLAHTKPQARCAVISPMSSVFLRYNVEDERAAKEVDKSFERLQKKLNAHAIEYQIADERLLEKYGSTENNRLRVGQCVYDFVVVPDCANLSASTKEILKNFVSAGGKILCEGTPRYTDGLRDDWSFLASNTSWEEIAAGGAIALETDGKAEYTYRVGNEYSFLFLVNPAVEEAHVRVPAGFSKIDLVTFAISKTYREITLGAGESVVLVPECGKPAVVYNAPHDLTRKLKCVRIGENALPLDAVRIGKDGKNFGDEQPIAGAFDGLLRERYEGRLFVSFAFDVKEIPEKIKLRREKGNYLAATVNGTPLRFRQSKFDVNFEEADIAAALVAGRNEYVAELNFHEDPHVYYALFSPEATESLRNCLVYDTELEPVTLIGEFNTVNRKICLKRLPASTSRIETQGYEHFAGKTTFGVSVFGETPLARLTLRGNFCAAEVKVNGRKAGDVFENGSIEFFVNEGEENYIEIEVSSSLRNLMGPFHFKNGGEDGIGPAHFTMRGMWQNGTCELYDEAYKIVPFGIDEAVLSFGSYK